MFYKKSKWNLEIWKCNEVEKNYKISEVRKKNKWIEKKQNKSQNLKLLKGKKWFHDRNFKN